jgi:hypothetical protein
VPLARPPLDTVSTPKSDTTVPITVPPLDTVSTPPLDTTVLEAVPPENTKSVSPLMRTKPLLVWPVVMLVVVISQSL